MKALDDALTTFYKNPPKGYHEDAEAGNIDWNDPDHIFHRKITNHGFPGAQILDVGCGTAMSCPWFLKRKASYTGVDLSLNQIKKNKDRYPDFNFIHMHWRKIPKLGAVYDIVASFFVLEHIVYPQEFLGTSACCVKPGGFIAVLCPDFLNRGFLPSQHFFGRQGGGIIANLKKLHWFESGLQLFDRYIIYPMLINRARRMSNNDGAWLINLRPVCLDVESWARDWDAVYMAHENEITNYLENLGFKTIERGETFRNSPHSGTYPNFAYVLAQKTC